ncbi:MAG: septum formation initiator family protein [bacterium]|nr:septum formation initiator family protein [bacterium]
MKRKALENIEDEQMQEGKKPKRKAKKWHYSLLTILLLLFLVQLFWGVIINSAKFYSLRTKIATLEKINKKAHQKNRYLREELEKYTSNTGVEALARNRLQFSKEDETLVIIKTSKQDEEE